MLTRSIETACSSSPLPFLPSPLDLCCLWPANMCATSVSFKIDFRMNLARSIAKNVLILMAYQVWWTSQIHILWVLRVNNSAVKITSLYFQMDEIEHPIPIYVEALSARFWVLLKAGRWEVEGKETTIPHTWTNKDSVVDSTNVKRDVIFVYFYSYSLRSGKTYYDHAKVCSSCARVYSFLDGARKEVCTMSYISRILFLWCCSISLVVLTQFVASNLTPSNLTPQLCNEIKTGNSLHIQQEKQLRQVRFACLHILWNHSWLMHATFCFAIAFVGRNDGPSCQSPWKVASAPLLGPSEIKRYDFWSGGRELVALQENQDRAAVMNEKHGPQADSMVQVDIKISSGSQVSSFLLSC